MEEQSLESFRRVLDVNLQGPWLGMRAVAPSLRRAGGGVIVNISSLAGPTSYAGIGWHGRRAGAWTVRTVIRRPGLR
ncbi:SDR family NAD(P)-dependent oxidoreductase [Streptomyces sp. NPDC002787]